MSLCLRALRKVLALFVPCESCGVEARQQAYFCGVLLLWVFVVVLVLLLLLSFVFLMLLWSGSGLDFTVLEMDIAHTGQVFCPCATSLNVLVGQVRYCSTSAPIALEL